jgi:polar amino acid transport system permease protein
VGYGLDFGWLVEALGAIARGAATTLLLIAVTTVAGTLLSILGAAVRNTPFLVQLFFIYFGLPALGIRLDPIVSAMLAMTLNMAAYTTEIVGAGLDAVPRGQSEAALALGLSPRQVFVKIVLPQALRVIFPALTGQIIIMMLESAVVSQIAVRELTYEADMLSARTFRAFETYLVITLVYLALSIGLRRLLIAGGRRTLSAGVS